MDLVENFVGALTEIYDKVGYRNDSSIDLIDNYQTSPCPWGCKQMGRNDNENGGILSVLGSLITFQN
jgi:hypothetical protein